MYCTKCGRRLEGENATCTFCNQITTPKGNSSDLKTASIVLGIISIVTAVTFLFAILGVILSIIGLILAICALKKVNNASGITLNIVGGVLSLINVIILLRIIFLFIQTFGNGIDFINNEYTSGKRNGLLDEFYNEILENFNLDSVNDFYEEYNNTNNKNNNNENYGQEKF